jgi:hypothetical protein
VLQARKVEPARLADIEQQMRRMGPFTRRKDLLAPGTGGRPDRKANNAELQISVEGTLVLSGARDPDNDAWLVGELDLGGGVTREIRYPADAEERPVGEECEWVLRVGKPGAYWLRLFHRRFPAS